MIDLHMHTVVSDGTDTPGELLEKIRNAGISWFAVTDHDSIAACQELLKLIPELKKKEGSGNYPCFINGVELSCEDEEGKYHILGYGYDLAKGNIRALTKKTHSLRMIKLERRLQNLPTARGFIFKKEDLDELRSLNNPGKPHIGNLMVKYGYAATRSEAITKYLNRYSPPEGHIRPEEAIRATLADGGIPVLAHAIYGDGDQLIMGEELENRVRKLKEFGMQGLECYYSGFVPKQTGMMLDLAERYDMYVTAGSDYHGTNKLIPLGDTGLEGEADACPRLAAFLRKVPHI